MHIKNMSGKIIFKDGSKNIKECVIHALKRNIHLTGANFIRAELPNINFSGAELSEADFSRANLSDTDFFGANLYWTKFTRANLTRSNLTRANLTHADFIKADLSWSKLTRANVTQANFFGANIFGANIDFASWPLCCGSKNVKIDEKIAKQLAMHMLSAIGDMWPGGLTDEQRDWVNSCHRVVDGSFDRI